MQTIHVARDRAPLGQFSEEEVRSGLGSGRFVSLYQVGFNAASGKEGAPIWAMLLVVLIGVVLVPVMLLIVAGLQHLVLMLLGGANHPFETTLRTAAYAFGSSSPLQIVPVCGGIVGAIWGIVVLCIGLSKTQNCSTGKAIVAVLAPILVCCGLGLALAIFGGIGAALAAKSMQ